MLYYVPLEPIKGRYTEQWSRPFTGWLERNWIKAKVDYIRIDGPNPSSEVGLGIGRVINPTRRAEWGFAQTQKIIQSLVAHEMTEEDVVFFDDFWHPGLEMIAQTRDAAYGNGGGPSLYSFCHAQSVDQYDFMHRSRNWVRPIEAGFMRIYDGVFVNNDYLKELLLLGLGDATPVYNCGHVFSSEECKEHVLPSQIPARQNKVVFTSRFDNEKQPHLFMDVVEQTIALYPEITFTICSGGELKSNDLSAVMRAKEMAAMGLLEIKANLSKTAYYSQLQSAKIQLSTSLQDWVSFCLLEAVTFGCYPLYPNYRSFPEAFGRASHSLYSFHPGVERSVVISNIIERIVGQCRIASMMQAQDYLFDNIVRRHNTTWKRQLEVMGVPFSG